MQVERQRRELALATSGLRPGEYVLGNYLMEGDNYWKR